jgi:hypothetical protein
MFEGWLAQLSTIENSLAVFAPKAVGVIVLIIAGLVIGGVLRYLARKIILKYKIDDKLLKDGRYVIRLGVIIPTVIAWATYLLFIEAAVDLLGLPVLSDALKVIVSWIPELVEILVIVLAGYLIAEYARIQIKRTKLEYSDEIGTILFFMIIYITVALSLPLVGVNPALLNNILLVAVGSLGLGLALALGLGLKDTVADIAKKYRIKKIKKKR